MLTLEIHMRGPIPLDMRNSPLPSTVEFGVVIGAGAHVCGVKIAEGIREGGKGRGGSGVLCVVVLWCRGGGGVWCLISWEG